MTKPSTILKLILSTLRAHSYIDVIAEIIRLAERKSNKAVRLFLYRHALRETWHFFGLYRHHEYDRLRLKVTFRHRISKVSLARGISSKENACYRFANPTSFSGISFLKIPHSGRNSPPSRRGLFIILSTYLTRGQCGARCPHEWGKWSTNLNSVIFYIAQTV